MHYRNFSKAKVFTMKNIEEKKQRAGASEAKTKRLTIDIPDQLHRMLKIQAVNDEVTMTDIVRQLLVQQFAQDDG
jgi:ATP-dependent Clp protease adapter protein ClpS